MLKPSIRLVMIALMKYEEQSLEARRILRNIKKGYVKTPFANNLEFSKGAEEELIHQ